MCHEVFITLLEMPVHVGIYQSEYDGLVSNECLVVAFGIRNRRLVGTAVGKFPKDTGRFPVFVLQFLDGLYPIVRHIHGHAVVKSHTAVFEGQCQSGHSGHFFGNGDGIGINLMDELVGKRKVADGIHILAAVIVVAIASESLSQPMAVIEHGRHPVETESVETIFLKPISAVGKEEMNDFVFSIVKAKAVPCRMFATVALTEILRGVAGKVSEALVFVLHSMALYKIHNHGYALCVSSVNEGLQLVRRTTTAAGGEEGADMISKGAIIRMLLDGHNLNAIVAILHYTRQDILTEFVIRSHFLCILRHPDVALVDKQRVLVDLEFFGLESVRLFGRPNLCGKDMGLFVLYRPCAISRNAFSLSAFPMYGELVQIAMVKGLCGEFEFPVSTVAKTLEGIFR